MTPMLMFTLRLLREHKGKPICGAFVGARWADANNQKKGVSSRRSFGFTAAGYRALRSLCEKGMAKVVERKTAGGYTILDYYITEYGITHCNLRCYHNPSNSDGKLLNVYWNKLK